MHCKCAAVSALRSPFGSGRRLALRAARAAPRCAVQGIIDNINTSISELRGVMEGEDAAVSELLSCLVSCWFS